MTFLYVALPLLVFVTYALVKQTLVWRDEDRRKEWWSE